MGQENVAGSLTRQSNKQLTLITAGALAFHVDAYQAPSTPHADFSPALVIPSSSQ